MGERLMSDLHSDVQFAYAFCPKCEILSPVNVFDSLDLYECASCHEMISSTDGGKAVWFDRTEAKLRHLKYFKETK